MNVQHLKYAMEVERVGSVTDAAENLYISQPSLSKAIRELESNLGFSVFERTARGMIPTPKGRLLLNHAYAIVKQLSEIEALAANDEMEQQTLSLSVPVSGYIAQAIVRFTASLDPQKPVNLRVREAGAMQTIDAVSDGSFRLGILRYPMGEEARFLGVLKKRDIRSEAIWEFEQVVLMSSGNPLAALSRVTPADLETCMEFVCPDASDLRNSDVPQPRNSRGKATLFCGRAMQMEQLSAIPSAFLWADPQPAAVLSRYHLVQRPGEQQDRRMCDRLIYPSDYRFSPGERAFIDKLFEVKNEVAFDS